MYAGISEKIVLGLTILLSLSFSDGADMPYVKLELDSRDVSTEKRLKLDSNRYDYTANSGAYRSHIAQN